MILHCCWQTVKPGNPKITEENEDYAAFVKALNEVNTYLAKHMAADGEGASALFEVEGDRVRPAKADAVTLEQICHHIESDEGCDLRP